MSVGYCLYIQWRSRNECSFVIAIQQHEQGTCV